MPVSVSPALMEEPATSSLAMKTTSGTNLLLTNVSRTKQVVLNTEKGLHLQLSVSSTVSIVFQTSDMF